MICDECDSSEGPAGGLVQGFSVIARSNSAPSSDCSLYPGRFAVSSLIDVDSVPSVVRGGSLVVEQCLFSFCSKGENISQPGWDQVDRVDLLNCNGRTQETDQKDGSL